MNEALRVIVARILGLFGRRRSEDGFEAEAATHLDLLTDRFIGQGMSPVEARQAACRQFGGLSHLRDTLRDQRSYPAIESLLKDFALAFRQIRTAPRFTLAAVSILALGIGASTGVFSVINALLLRPLPYPDADRLVWVGEVLKGNSTDEVTLTPNFLDWRRKNSVFSSVAAYNVFLRTLITNGGAIQLRTLKASAAIFDVLKTKPLIGRAFFPSEDIRGQDQVAILSYDLWQQAFGGDKDVIGRLVTLEDGNYVAVGVLPRGFRFPALGAIDVITPLGKNEALELARRNGTTTIVGDVVARLKPGVDIRQARAEMEVIESHLAPPSFLQSVQMSVKVVPLQERFVGNLRFALLTLLCAVGSVLLLVCANVANLLLGRGESRRREMAIRAALGASRGRITQQLLVESLVLALLGCGIGLLIAFWSRGLLLSLIPQTLPGQMALPLDFRVAGFAILSGIATALLFGLGPALANANAGASSALTSGGRSVGGGVRRQVWLNGLASAQMAIAIVLLAGGGLMLQSFWKLRYQDLGFSADRVATASVNLSRGRYPTTAHQIIFLDAVLDRFRSVPGVEDAGFGVLPPGDGHATNGFSIEGRALPPQGRRPVARQYSVSPGFFRMLGVAIRGGRDIAESDASLTVPVALINEAFARSQFSGENPIGQRIRFEANSPFKTIVGVVADVKTAGLANSAEPCIFVPYRQSGFVGGEGAGFVIRTTLDAASLAPELRKRVAQVDPQVPMINIQMLEQRLNESVARPRLAAVMLGGFAALGLVLAAIGLHSVMFVLVRSRFREIGIRLALGGQPRDVVWMILGHSLRVQSVGLMIGVCCAVWVSRALRGLWYGIAPADPITLAVASALLVSVGLAASCLPARQASRIDPMKTLRSE